MKKINNPNNFNPGVLKKLNEKRNFIRYTWNNKEEDLEKELDLDCKKSDLENEYQKFNKNFNKYTSENFDFVCYLDKYDNKGNVKLANQKFKEIYEGHVMEIVDEKRTQLNKLK